MRKWSAFTSLPKWTMLVRARNGRNRKSYSWLCLGTVEPRKGSFVGPSLAPEKNWGSYKRVRYTVTTDYAIHGALVATVTTKDSHVMSLILTRFTALQAEVAAIALTIMRTPVKAVITDSQSACNSYLQGRTSHTTAKISNQNPPKTRVSIVCTPAYTYLCCNVFAHETARGSLKPDGWLQTITLTSFKGGDLDT